MLLNPKATTVACSIVCLATASTGATAGGITVYKGDHGEFVMKVTVGNANFPFSREFLTASKYQQLVERTFVGDYNYGTPDRNPGVHLTGHTGNKQLAWAASATSADTDPDNKKPDFDTPVNRNEDDNQGWMFGGGIDYMPFGKVKLSQGDFGGHASRSASTISSRKNDIKLQATWRNNDNKDGVDGNDEKEGFIQARYVF
jgi:hypothetical protein